MATVSVRSIVNDVDDAIAFWGGPRGGRMSLGITWDRASWRRP